MIHIGLLYRLLYLLYRLLRSDFPDNALDINNKMTNKKMYNDVVCGVKPIQKIKNKIKGQTGSTGQMSVPFKIQTYTFKSIHCCLATFTVCEISKQTGE